MSSRSLAVGQPATLSPLEALGALRLGARLRSLALSLLGGEPEARRRAEHEATRVLAAGRDIDETLPEVIQSLCTSLDWAAGLYWEVDLYNSGLRPLAAWTEAGRPRCFVDDSRGRVFRLGEDLPGRAWGLGAPVWIPDIRSDSRILRSDAARGSRLVTGLAVPVVARGEVVGILELAHRDAVVPGRPLLEMLADVGSQVSQYLERKRSEDALRSSEAMLEHMLEGLVVVDEKAIIRRVNRAAEQIFGYSRNEMLGQPMGLLLPPHWQQDRSRKLIEARNQALNRATEWQGRRKDGEVFPLELSLYEFQTPAGRRLAGQVRDVSERHKVERLKEEFVATVSHELRTPLTSIRGSLGLLAGGVVGNLEPEARELVSIAERNALHLMGLINDILDVEKLDSGRMELSLAVHGLQPLLERAAEVVRGAADAAGVRIELGATHARSRLDADRIVQVLVNLLSNAVKFSRPGSSVVVSTRDDRGVVEVSVRDTGRGIPASHHAAVFDRFRQVEASDARQKGGTGLGLAICKSIVEQHGGTIGLWSEPGHGSRFFFRLPSAATGSAEVAA